VVDASAGAFPVLTLPVRFHCQAQGCPGFQVLPGERFCPWCGAPQTRMTLGLEFRHQGEWKPLDPPNLRHGQRPELRVVIRHEGRTGSVRLLPGCVSSSVPWLRVQNPSSPVLLQDGEEHRLALESFKPPQEGPGERVTLTLDAEGHLAELVLGILPVPVFVLEPARVELRTERDQGIRTPVDLILQRGASRILAPPVVSPGFARLEWPQDVGFPLDLQAEGRSVLHGHLVIPASEVSDLRERAVFRVDLQCTGREDTPPRLEIEARVLATPELVVEPFLQDRHDWSVVRGVSEGDLLELTLRNGAEVRSDRTSLEISRLEILPAEGHLEIRRGADQFPCTLSRTEHRTVALGLRAGLEPGREHLFTLVFHTNEQRPRHRYLAVEVREPRVFPGWLAVDLGTTSTCAALVDDAMRVETVELERSPAAEDRSSLLSAVLYRRLEQERDFEVGHHAWSVFLDHPRSTVLGAKRRTGDPDHRFEIVPVEEQMVKRELKPVEVLEDLFSAVASKAAAFLARAGERGTRLFESDQLLPTRLLLSHPSRFTLRQVDELKGAAARAFSRHLQALRQDLAITDIVVIQEPIAAALSFLNDPQTHSTWHEKGGQDHVAYHVLVFDCGGGTTDLTLLRVESWRRSIQPDPGEESFEQDLEEASALERLSETPGWADLLREAVTGEILQRAEEVLALRSPGTRLARAGVAEEESDHEANRLVVGAFAESLVGRLPIAVLLGDDPEAWGRLVRSPRSANRLSLRMGPGHGGADEIVETREVFPEPQALRRRLLVLAEQRQEPGLRFPGAWRYRVRVRVLGASGHPRFGGEEMTEAVLALLRRQALAGARRLHEGRLVEIPDEPSRVPFSQELSARRNRATLLFWAESVKIALAGGLDAAQARPPAGLDHSRLEILVDNQVERVGLDKLLAGGWPDRSHVEALLEDGIQQTVSVARGLVTSGLGQDPEVVLLTGRASLWPQVERCLARAFPKARQARPRGDLKQCVVEGAPLSLNLGPVSARHEGVMLDIQDGVQISTCRVGVAAKRAGGMFFQEILADGLPIPPEGLAGQTEIGFNRPGPSLVQILENAGREDRLSLPGGDPNPDIREVCVDRFEIPEDLGMWGLDGVLSLRLTPDLRLHVRLALGEQDGGEPAFVQDFPPIDPDQLGRGY
jgi:hypothetical protein